MAVLETKRVIHHQKRRRMNKKMRRFQMFLRIAILLATVLVAGVLVYMLCFAKYETVNLPDLTKVELSGYNGKGLLEVSTKKVAGYEEFFDTVEAHVINTEETVNGQLSNGDKVEIEYTYDKKMAKSLGLRVKASEEYVDIKDLPESTKISTDDLFEGIEIKYEGVAPLIIAEMVNNTSDEVLQTVAFEIVDPKEYYDDGDIITVKASCDLDTFEKNDYELLESGSEFTAEYKIEADERYIKDASELPTELLEKMKEHGTTLFGKESGDANEFGLRIFSDAGRMYTTEGTEYTFRFTGSSFISAYFTCVNEEYIGQSGTHYNDVKIVYDTGISQSDGQSVAAEAVVIYRNIIQHSDGSVDVDLNDGQIISVSRRDDQIKNLVKSTDDDQYTSVKLEQ